MDTRSIQQILPTDSTYYNIPSLVNFICILYFHIKEYFDQISDNNLMSSNATRDTVMMNAKSSVSGRAAGTLIISINDAPRDNHYIYLWELETLTSFGSFDGSIGISNGNTTGRLIGGKEFWYWSDGDIELPHAVGKYIEYGAGVKIKMEINTRNKQLFYLNDDKCGYSTIIEERHFGLSFTC